MTLSRLTLIVAIVAALLGIGHSAMTPLIYPGWTTSGLWFVGTGLAMLTAATLNVVGRDSRGGVNVALIALVNSAMTAFFVSAWLVLRAPQVIVGGVLFAGLTACAALAARRRSRE